MLVAVFAAVLLLFAPAASAKSYSVAARVAEPNAAYSVALADGRVVWLERRGAGAELVMAGEDGVPHDVLALRPVRGGVFHYLNVVAGGNTAIVDRMVCDAGCGRITIQESLRVDLATGAATALKLSDCHFSLRASVLAMYDCYGPGIVIDLADGTRRTLDGHVLDAAGSYAAVIDDNDVLSVVNWRTGAVLGTPQKVFLVTGATNVSIDTDGTLVWVEEGQDAMKVLAPGAAAPVVVNVERDGELSVRAAGGLIAVRDWTDSRAALRVSARDGSGLRTVDAQRGSFGWAFDGTRLAWVAQPCAQTVIQVWDLSTNPPPPTSERCTRARPDELALSRDRRQLSAVLHCPKVPARGCAGVVKAVLYRGTRRLASTDSGDYRIEAGKRATVTLLVRGRPHITGRIVARVNGGARLRVARKR
jgi:hypothetical protein